jgi:hypothetical protein
MGSYWQLLDHGRLFPTQSFPGRKLRITHTMTAPMASRLSGGTKRMMAIPTDGVLALR